MEDQLLELEALESLFPEEMRRDPGGSDSKFSLVNLVPFSDHSQKNHVSVSIDFVFPPGYPAEERIHFSLSKLTGPIATDSSKLDELTSLIESEIEANFGMCAVYQIVEKVTEWLRENNEEEKSLFDQISRPMAARIQDSDDSDDSDWSENSDECDSDEYSDSEESSDGEYHGLQLKNLCVESARVTDSQFAAWMTEYEEWLISAGVIKRSLDQRPTGKEQFLNNLANRKGGEAKGSNSDQFDPTLYDDDALLDGLMEEEEVS